MPHPTHGSLDDDAATISAALPPGERVAILGSTSFWSVAGEPIYRLLGEELARRESVVLLSGGMTGVAECTSASFLVTRNRLRLASNLFHIVPLDTSSACVGPVIEAGGSLAERRELLARVASRYIVVEGGPGTAHETEIALARGARVIPVGISGGVAAKLHATCADAYARQHPAWNVLNDKRATVARVVRAAMTLCFDDSPGSQPGTDPET